MNVLVTGGRGFIGRSVVRRLEERGDVPVVLRHRWDGITDLEGRLPPGEIRGCIHLGWYAEPRDYLVNVPQNRQSLLDSLDLVKVLGERGCISLVVAGSSAEYATSERDLSEDMSVAPWSVYGAAKASLHLLLGSSLAPAELVVSWARIFNVTGPGEDRNRLLPHVARSVMAGHEVPLSAGTQIRDFSHVDDVAEGLVTLLDAASPGTYNISSGRGVPLSEALTQLAGQLGEPALLQFGLLERGENDPDRVVGSNTALSKLGWSPRHDLTQTLTAVADYWRTAPSVSSSRG